MKFTSLQRIPLTNTNKKSNRTPKFISLRLQVFKCRIFTANQSTDLQAIRRLHATRSHVDRVRIPRAQDRWWGGRARSRRRLIVIRRLLSRTGSKCITREGKVSTTVIEVRTQRLAEAREQEFEGAGCTHCRGGNDEVEDGAEVVGGYLGFLG